MCPAFSSCKKLSLHPNSWASSLSNTDSDKTSWDAAPRWWDALPEGRSGDLSSSELGKLRILMLPWLPPDEECLEVLSLFVIRCCFYKQNKKIKKRIKPVHTSCKCDTNVYITALLSLFWSSWAQLSELFVSNLWRQNWLQIHIRRMPIKEVWTGLNCSSKVVGTFMYKTLFGGVLVLRRPVWFRRFKQNTPLIFRGGHVTNTSPTHRVLYIVLLASFKGLGTVCTTQNTDVHRFTLNFIHSLKIMMDKNFPKNISVVFEKWIKQSTKSNCVSVNLVTHILI